MGNTLKNFDCEGETRENRICRGNLDRRKVLYFFFSFSLPESHPSWNSGVTHSEVKGNSRCKQLEGGAFAVCLRDPEGKGSRIQIYGRSVIRWKFKSSSTQQEEE